MLKATRTEKQLPRTGGAAWETRVYICCMPPYIYLPHQAGPSPDLLASTEVYTAELQAIKWIGSAAVYRRRRD